MNAADEILPTIHETAFLKLLDSGGHVQVAIQPFGRYFVPFVYYAESETSERLACGVIVRQRSMLAALTPRELLDVLFDLAGHGAAMCIEQIGSSEERVDLRARLPAMH